MTDFSTAAWTEVLSFIVLQFPDLKGLDPTKVEQQVVAGYNYRVTYSLQGKTIVLVVYSDLKNALTLTSYTVNGVSPANFTQVSSQPSK